MANQLSWGAKENMLNKDGCHTIEAGNLNFHYIIQIGMGQRLAPLQGSDRFLYRSKKRIQSYCLETIIIFFLYCAPNNTFFFGGYLHCRSPSKPSGGPVLELATMPSTKAAELKQLLFFFL